MPKLYQEIENIFRFRILSNDEIPSYMKRMSGMGKMDEVAKQALMTLILSKLGEMEDEEAQHAISREYVTKRYEALGGNGSDGPLITNNESALQDYEKPIDVVQTGLDTLTITEKERKQAIKEKRIAAMAKARAARAAKKTLK